MATIVEESPAAPPVDQETAVQDDPVKKAEELLSAARASYEEKSEIDVNQAMVVGKLSKTEKTLSEDAMMPEHVVDAISKFDEFKRSEISLVSEPSESVEAALQHFLLCVQTFKPEHEDDGITNKHKKRLSVAIAPPAWQEVRDFASTDFRPLVLSITVEVAASFRGVPIAAALKAMADRAPIENVDGAVRTLYSWSYALVQCVPAYKKLEELRAQLVLEREQAKIASKDMVQALRHVSGRERELQKANLKASEEAA